MVARITLASVPHTRPSRREFPISFWLLSYNKEKPERKKKIPEHPG